MRFNACGVLNALQISKAGSTVLCHWKVSQAVNYTCSSLADILTDDTVQNKKGSSAHIKFTIIFKPDWQIWHLLSNDSLVDGGLYVSYKLSYSQNDSEDF